MSEAIDALFLSHFVDLDRWHAAKDGDYVAPHLGRARATLDALSSSEWMKDELDLVVEGRLLDFSRFLSLVRYGDTSEWRRYDPFTMTLLVGNYHASFLQQQGFRVRVTNLATRETLGVLAGRYTPRFVLLSTTLAFDAAGDGTIRSAVAEIRRSFPGAIVVLGGLMLVSYQKNLAHEQFAGLLRHYGADAYVVTPRGELPLAELLRRRSKAAILEDPPPATYVVDGGSVRPPREAEDPVLALEAGSVRWASLEQRDHLYHTVHLRTARSCAFSCAFCEYPVNQGPLTLMPLEVVDRELGELRSLGTVRSVVFTDDTFNVPAPRFKELLRILARHELGWYSFLRPQYLDRETAELMKASGCRAVFAGLESVDDRVLENMHKAATADAYRRGIALLQEQGIAIHANFIVGFPGETEASARKVVSFLDETGIDFCTVCVWSYIPSTPIARRAAEFGLEGMGVEWRHATMTSQEAQALARQVAQEQRRSVHNAVRGECWSEFLLDANGLTRDEIKLAISSFNSFLGRDQPLSELRARVRAAGLEDVLAKRDLPVPAL